mmetsp:Transcript_30893/g.41016  ORF Transcript_30893/g.41016 Transcript_30893/m.41016 type:complete len:103 (-) Transcript_30893:227-535(-)
MAGRLVGILDDQIVLSDVTPLTVGFEVSEKVERGLFRDWLFGPSSVRVMEPMVRKNTVIPFESMTKTVWTQHTEVDVLILEGDERLSEDNHVLSKICLKNIE